MSENSVEDEYVIRFITSETIDDAIAIVINFFLTDETVAKALKLFENPEAVKDVVKFALLVAEDGLSCVAIEKQTQKVVGAMFWKIQVKREGCKTFFEEFIETCNHKSFKAWLQIMNNVECKEDIFALIQANCCLEGVISIVHPEYRGKGIGSKLEGYGIEIIKSLKNGINVKRSLDSKPMPIEPVPRAVTGVATSVRNQQVLSKLGFKTCVAVKYSSLTYEGVSLKKGVDDGPEYLKLVYIIV